MSPFDPFRRLRLRSRPVPTLPSSSEDDSDESSPERGRPHIVHVTAPKNVRKSGDHLLTIPESGKRGAPDKVTESTHISLTLDKAPPRPERPSRKPFISGVVNDSVDALQPPTKPTLIRRVTSKLHISIPSKSGPQLRSRPSTRTLPIDSGPPTHGPRSPRATIPVSPTLPNSFVSKENREAALRERGLLPPRKDLSAQEREADERLRCVPSPVSITFDGSTEAERLKASWLAVNRTSESSDSECGPPAPPHLQPNRSPSSTPPDANVLRRLGEGRTDLPPAGRPSFCSSVPPLSTSSYLEVLHEEPWEQGPITPPPLLSPPNLPVIVSSSLEPPPSPILVESPISCTFSSLYPGSTLESHSQSSHPPFPEKENIHWPAPRSRTSDSGDRPPRVVGSLSKLGTRSLSNLRRSIAGSLMVPSSSTLSIADRSSTASARAPRTAIDPTIHSIGSIIRETRDIQDAESRRLTERAFLD
ncbi:hypothetical protein HD554DRAFT_2310555 [Boletus coccyginus]|nr:hypothetical protein HD554DRAFT_2310555 [Boletus coccyginus]